jgi:hypothetical protein
VSIDKQRFLDIIEARMLRAELYMALMFTMGRWSKLSHHSDRRIKAVRRRIKRRLLELGDTP